MRAKVDPVKARTRQLHATLRRRAGSRPVMSLEELRARFDDKIRNRPFCGYCGTKVSCANVSLDHDTPLGRSGSSDATNLSFVCRRCNVAKGNMTLEEFKSLILALDSWAKNRRNPGLRDEVLLVLGGAGGRRR